MIIYHEVFASCDTVSITQNDDYHTEKFTTVVSTFMMNRMDYYTHDTQSNYDNNAVNTMIRTLNWKQKSITIPQSVKKRSQIELSSNNIQKQKTALDIDWPTTHFLLCDSIKFTYDNAKQRTSSRVLRPAIRVAFRVIG